MDWLQSLMSSNFFGAESEKTRSVVVKDVTLLLPR